MWLSYRKRANSWSTCEIAARSHAHALTLLAQTPVLVTLDIEDKENRLATVEMKRVTLVRESGRQEVVPIPQLLYSFRDVGSGRKVSLPVLENLIRHEPLELHVDVVLWRADGTQVEFRISGRLVPETRQGMTDAVTFTIYGIT